MKKILLTIALAIFAFSAIAENTPKKPSWQGFVSNSFSSNWEVSVGAGVGTFFSNGAASSGKFINRLGFEGNIAATKWFHPVIGGRLQLQGGYMRNVDPMMGNTKTPYLFIHTDFMVNLSNWIGGYREDRFYSIIPFWGFGYMTSNMTSKSHITNGEGTHQTFAFTYGLLNQFRLTKCVSFNLELKGMMMPSSVSAAQLNGSYMFGFSATAGFSFRFNKRGWQRGAAGFTADDIRGMQAAATSSQDALAKAQAENDRLAQALDNAKNDISTLQSAVKDAEAKVAAAPEVAREAAVVSAPSVLYSLGGATISAQEKIRLGLIAEQIKAGDADKVYKIVGHADKQTGNAEVNKDLSVKRAKSVYDYLVGKGVNAKQLTYEGLGGEKNPFSIQQANRTAVIEQ